MSTMRGFVRREKGTSLIEMAIAMVVLIVGLLSVMTLPMISISGNSRNRWDSSGTMLAEMVVDQVSSLPVGSSSTSITITDCAMNTHTIQSAGAVSGAGANVSMGSIDFTQSFSAIAPGYSMMYTVCGTSTNRQSVYDVRWNVQTITPKHTDFVTVSARIANWSGSPQLFAIPVSLRTVVGNAGF
jgi:Tfp pilus assembly protein PilV